MTTDTQIEDAVLAVLEPTWQKVAMIVSKAVKRLGPDFPDDDSGYQMVAKRIQVLARNGRLVSQGDLRRWRQSEVRRSW